MIACQIKDKYQIPAKLVLYTPLYEALPYIHRENRVELVAVGDKDQYIDVMLLREVCEKEQIRCYIEPGVGHRMEVMNDLNRNLEVIANVLKRLR